MLMSFEKKKEMHLLKNPFSHQWDGQSKRGKEIESKK